MATACAAIDTGHRTKELEKIILKHPTRLLAVKGVDGTSRDPAYIAREVSVEGFRKSGGGGKGGAGATRKDRTIRLVSVTVSQYKEQLYTDLGLEPRGSTRTVAEQASECRSRFPAYVIDRETGADENHDAYFSQLSSEYQVPEPISKSNPDGPKKLVWKVRPGRDGGGGENHYLDVRVYHLCLRDVLRLSKLSLVKMLAALQARVPASGERDPRGIQPPGSIAPGISRDVQISSSGGARPANPGGTSAGIGSRTPPPVVPPRRFTRRGGGLV